MAQQPLQTVGTAKFDALNMAPQAVASMDTQASGALTKPPDLTTNHISGDSIDPSMMPSMMPPPTTNVPSPFPENRAQNDDAEPDCSNLEPNQNAKQLQRGGIQDEIEVKIPQEHAQQDAKVEEEAQIFDLVAEAGERRDESSSDDLSDVEMSDESESRMSLKSEEEIDRLDKYAFSFAGQAYNHRVPQNLTGGTTLFASKLLQSTTISQYFEGAREQDALYKSPNLIPHSLEMKAAPKTVECIWVGMLPYSQNSHKRTASASVEPQVLNDPTSPGTQSGVIDAAEVQVDGPAKARNKTKKRPTKVQLPIVDLEDEQLDVISFDPNALRVVAKKVDKPVKAWFLYALARQNSISKLCQGWKVAFEEVFFFKTFRDDTITGFMKRRQATDSRIKAVTFPANPRPSDARSVSFDRLSTQLSSTPAPPSSSLPTIPSSKRKGKGKASRVISGGNIGQAAGVKQADETEGSLNQKGGQFLGPVDKIDDCKDSILDNQLATKSGARGVETARLEPGPPELAGIFYEDGDDDAYPEHAVSPTSRPFMTFIDDMVRQLAVVGPTDMNPGEKRKRVAFEPSREQAANSRRKTGGILGSNDFVRGYEVRAESASFVAQQDTEYLVKKLTSLVDKLAAKQDTAGLRQCVTMVECIEKRCRPGPKSALGPYLSISSRNDQDPEFCCGKLREILDLFPNLEDVDIDNHVLAWMISGLRATGQSVDINLIEPCVICFSRLYKQKYGETSNHQVNMKKGVLVDMICQARDDAEKMVKRSPSNSNRKVWAPHLWIDPRQNLESIKID
ncbi:hypothetical protein N8I77_013148 [Diaporthe amygdali]|uniref:Uncharacterized protein n=1 Tax=Phomopsis amygdali TaxID=1214568 RepID=A0AAD9VYR1_PHOAM|nr:hypothetical protein N8I77_013148 [Diaporthe amygdali]